MKIVYCRYFSDIIVDFIKLIPNSIIVENIEINDLSMYLILNLKDIIKLPQNFIVFNFEQLTNDNVPKSIWKKFKRAHKCFDYSYSNLCELNKHHIDAIVIPYSWQLSMKKVKIILPFENRKNTILFIGSMNERRRNILKPIHTMCKSKDLTMYLSNECWDEHYINILSISKIALNIHYYSGNTILEVHRILPYIMNKIIVISEHSNDEYYDNLLNDYITWTSEETFTDTIEYILSMSNNDINTLLSYRQRKMIQEIQSFTLNVKCYCDDFLISDLV